MINQIIPFLSKEVEIRMLIERMKLDELIEIKKSNPTLYKQIKSLLGW